MRAHRVPDLKVGPPEGDLGALVVIHTHMRAEHAPPHRHPKVLPPGHDDSVDEADDHPEDQRARPAASGEGGADLQPAIRWAGQVTMAFLIAQPPAPLLARFDHVPCTANTPVVRVMS